MRLIKLYKAGIVKGENVVLECKALQEQVKVMEKSGWSRSAKKAERELPTDSESKIVEPKVVEPKIVEPKVLDSKTLK